MKDVEKMIGAKTYVVSDELNDLAEEVIKENKLDLNGARIEYMFVFPHVSKTTAGKCMRTTKELKFYSDKDYIIQISGELYDVLDHDVRKILMLHELLHVHPVNNEKKGEVEYKILDHDVKDFNRIIKNHGIDWFNKLREEMSSLYELENEQINL